MDHIKGLFFFIPSKTSGNIFQFTTFFAKEKQQKSFPICTSYWSTCFKERIT
jgi:hypothetical protein